MLKAINQNYLYEIYSNFLILILNLTTTFSQQVEEIISKHINAIGGSELWGKVNSISYNGYVKMNGGQKAKY